MRIGNLVLLLLLVLVGFGFLLAYAFDLINDLNETRAQLERLQLDWQTLNSQYQLVVEEKNRLSEQVTGLSSQNADLQTRIDTLEAERLELRAQIDRLQKELELIKQSAPLLAWFSSGSLGRLAAALLLVPVLPLSLRAIYAITHPKSDPGSRGNTVYTALTREEFHLIALHRRSRA